MAASSTLPHSFPTPQISKSGVLTVYGFGIRITVQAGHLQVEDGIGPERRRLRLPRVNHKLKRLVCIGDDGFVTSGRAEVVERCRCVIRNAGSAWEGSSRHRTCITQRGTAPQIAGACPRKWQCCEDRPRTHFSQTQRARSTGSRKTEEHTSSGFHCRTSGLVWMMQPTWMQSEGLNLGLQLNIGTHGAISRSCSREKTQAGFRHIG